MILKSFLYSNAFMTKSGAQPLTFKIVTDKQTERQTDKNSTLQNRSPIKFGKFLHNRTRDTPPRGVYIPTFGIISVKSSVLGSYTLRSTPPCQISPRRATCRSYAGRKNLRMALALRAMLPVDSSTAQCRTGWPPCRVKIPRRKVWLTRTARVWCSNAANIGERKTWTQSEFCTWLNSVRQQEPPKMYIQCISLGDGQTSCNACLVDLR